METSLPRKSDPAFTFRGADVSMFMSRAPRTDLSSLDTSSNPRIIGDVAQLVNNPVNASTKSRNELYEIRAGDVTDETTGESYMQMSFVEPGTGAGGRDPVRMNFRFDDSRVVILRDPAGGDGKRLAIVAESAGSAGAAGAADGSGDAAGDASRKYMSLAASDYYYVSDEGKIVAVMGGRETETTWDKLFVLPGAPEGFKVPGGADMMAKASVASSQPILKAAWGAAV